MYLHTLNCSKISFKFKLYYKAQSLRTKLNLNMSDNYDEKRIMHKYNIRVQDFKYPYFYCNSSD